MNNHFPKKIKLHKIFMDNMQIIIHKRKQKPLSKKTNKNQKKNKTK